MASVGMQPNRTGAAQSRPRIFSSNATASVLPVCEPLLHQGDTARVGTRAPPSEIAIATPAPETAVCELSLIHI